MKLTEEQFQELFGHLMNHHEVVGLSVDENHVWNQGYSFAFSMLYDSLVVHGQDEDDKFFNRLDVRSLT